MCYNRAKLKRLYFFLTLILFSNLVALSVASAQSPTLTPTPIPTFDPPRNVPIVAAWIQRTRGVPGPLPVIIAPRINGYHEVSPHSFIMGQSLWDATMAYSISEYLAKNPGQKIFQVNGRFHSDERFAVVEQLKKYSPEAKVLVISSGSDDTFPKIDWDKFKHLGDYIIITDPKVPKSYDN